MKVIKKIGDLIMGFIENIINKIRGIKQVVSETVPVQIERNEYIKSYGHEQQTRINRRRRREEIARQSRREHYIQAKI